MLRLERPGALPKSRRRTEPREMERLRNGAASTVVVVDESECVERSSAVAKARPSRGERAHGPDVGETVGVARSAPMAPMGL